MVEAGESGDDQSTSKPPNIFDPAALLVYLEGKVNLLDFEACLYEVGYLAKRQITELLGVCRMMSKKCQNTERI